MSRNWQLFLEDIIESCEKIARRIEGLSFEQFVDDDVLYDAVIRNLEIIGEAAKGIPAEVRMRVPEIDWRRVGGLRDVFAHAYFAIDDATVWDVVAHKVPELLVAAQRLRSANISP